MSAAAPGENDVVRVVALSGSRRPPDFGREPVVGDEGTVVFVHDAIPGQEPGFAVECLDAEGATVWLADFLASELAVVR